MHASPIKPLFGLSLFNRRFTILTLLLLSVLFGLLGYTVATIQKEPSEALLIDLAGRQRMLLQKHMNEIFYASQQVPTDYTATRELIRSTLGSLMEGGSVVLNPETRQRQVIPSAPTEKIVTKLREQEQAFDNLVKLADYFLSLQPEDPEFSHHLQILRDQTSNVIGLADEAVKLLEGHAAARVGTIVKWETLIALLVGLLGLLFSWVAGATVHRSGPSSCPKIRPRNCRTKTGRGHPPFNGTALPANLGLHFGHGLREGSEF
jgi:hypothetical protein